MTSYNGDNEENKNNAKLLSSLELRKAFDKATMLLGRSSQEALFSELENAGIVLSDADKLYSLRHVRRVMSSIFGEDSAGLLMERIEKALVEVEGDFYDPESS